MQKKLDKFQEDALRELANIGAGNAATGIAKFIHRRISVQIPSVGLVELKNISDNFGGPESPVAGVYFRITSAFPGSVVLIFGRKEGEYLARLLTGQMSGTKGAHWGALEESAMREFGNIFVGAFMGALSRFLKSGIRYSVPGLAVDMLQAVLDSVLAPLALVADRAVVINTQFELEKEKIAGRFFLFLEPEGLNKLIKKLGDWQ